MPPSKESYDKLKRSISTASVATAVLEDHQERPELRKNLYELHWRTSGPRWKGNLDGAWGGKYSHLEDEVYCRHCGAVPCPLDHDDEKAIRLRDLDFIRGVVKDKKDLQERYDKLDAAMKTLLEASEGWRGERVLLIGNLNIAEKKKQEWDFERGIMEAELNRLKGINDKHLGQLSNHRRDQKKILSLEKRIQTLEGENEKLVAESQKVRQLLISKSDELERVRTDNRRLIVQLEDAQTSIRALKVQLDESNEERSKLQHDLDTRGDHMKHVDDEIKALLQELQVKTKDFEEKDSLSQLLIGELRRQILGIKARLEESERLKTDLQEQIDAYLREIEQMRQKLGRDKRFHQFVEIKRECNDLKTKNENLLQRVHFGHAYSIPLLNAEGHVALPTGRPSTALHMRRAKSATAFSSKERLYAVRKIRTTLKIEDLRTKPDD